MKDLYTITTYILTMETTIQINSELREALQLRKTSSKESYADVIWDLLEDTLELSDETKKELAESRMEARQGKVKSLSKIKRELGL